MTFTHFSSFYHSTHVVLHLLTVFSLLIRSSATFIHLSSYILLVLNLLTFLLLFILLAIFWVVIASIHCCQYPPQFFCLLFVILVLHLLTFSSYPSNATFTHFSSFYHSSDTYSLILSLVLLRVFPKHIFLRGGLLQPPSRLSILKVI